MPVFFFSYGENEERYLKKAITSNLMQTHSNFVFYIILDGYFPEAEKIIQNHADQDERIVFIKQDHMGLTKSLNMVLERIEEPFIARHDADDFSSPNRIERLLDAIIKHDKIGVVGDNYGVVNIMGHLTHINTADPENQRIDKLAGTIAGASLFRTKAIKEIGGWKYKYAQDFYMLVSMRKRNWILKTLKETLYFYRLHKNQISQAVRSQQKVCHRAIVEKECK